MEIGVFTAFFAGIISFLSPCVLPLAPPYLAYLGGTTLDQISGDDREIDPAITRRVFISAVFFVLGLATVFVMLGMGASIFGQVLVRYKPEFSFVAGGIIFGLGLHFWGLRASLWVAAVVIAIMGAFTALSAEGLASEAFFIDALWILAIAAVFFGIGRAWSTDRLPILDREVRFEGPQKAGSFGASYVIGVAFAFGWTPCIGPILGAILSLAAQEETLSAGTALLGVYALGLGMPFLIAALFVGPFLRWARNFRKHMPVVEKVMGMLLITVGLMMITGNFERLAYFLLETFPSLAEIG